MLYLPKIKLLLLYIIDYNTMESSQFLLFDCLFIFIYPLQKYK